MSRANHYNLFLKKMDEKGKKIPLQNPTPDFQAFHKIPLHTIYDERRKSLELNRVVIPEAILSGIQETTNDVVTPPDTTPCIVKKKVIKREINDISDLLVLIEEHPLDPLVEYDIQIAPMHSIKEPLQRLNAMVGMKSLKESIVKQILYFIQGLHVSSDGDYMHTMIYGPPGTGKTEVAHIMGSLFAKLGVLKKGTFKKVTRSDLVAGYLGQTAIKTRDVIKDALGGVLFIDEAYSLGNEEKKDSFSKECIDTLCEALSAHKDELMVIIAGYEKELKDCFFQYNQGLESRFLWRFQTSDYSGAEMFAMFQKKVADIRWTLDTDSITGPWFETRKSDFPFFGRDMETLLFLVKIEHGMRIFTCKGSDKETDKGSCMTRRIILEDLEKGFHEFIKRKGSGEKKSALESMYV